MAVWLLLACVTAGALLPLALRLRGLASSVGRKDAALMLHRTQLGELDRDLRDGLIGPEEHATARLEIQRRLLSEADATERPVEGARAGRGPVVAALVLVPAGALALYLLGGHPGLPAQPLAARIAASAATGEQDAALIAQLRAGLASMDPHSDKTRQGWLLLGQAEAQHGDWQGAADAWNAALRIGDDPTVRFEAAEAQTRASGHVSAASLAQFRQAVDGSAADAPWRMTAEQRIAEGEHSH